MPSRRNSTKQQIFHFLWQDQKIAQETGMWRYSLLDFYIVLRICFFLPLSVVLHPYLRRKHVLNNFPLFPKQTFCKFILLHHCHLLLHLSLLCHQFHPRSLSFTTPVTNLTYPIPFKPTSLAFSVTSYFSSPAPSVMPTTWGKLEIVCPLQEWSPILYEGHIFFIDQ